MSNSGVIQAMHIVAEYHKLTSWREINPMLLQTFWLLVKAEFVFDIDDFSRLSGTFGLDYWSGEGENFYSAIVKSGNKSAILSLEKHIKRQPFMVQGLFDAESIERVYVGKEFYWEKTRYTCTSIEPEYVRARVLDTFGKNPATVVTIPRTGFEEKVKREKEARTIEAYHKREKERPDPINLLPFDQHLLKEVATGSSNGGRYTWGRDASSVQPHAKWAESFGTDYKKAWESCENLHFMCRYLVWIGHCKEGPKGYLSTPEIIRKRYPWPAIEAQIFRFVRNCRSLPLKDTDKWKEENPVEALSKQAKIAEMQKRNPCPKLISSPSLLTKSPGTPSAPLKKNLTKSSVPSKKNKKSLPPEPSPMP